VNEGICLYNFFRTFPLDLTIYNAGNVGSIAAIAYLGVKTRKASANATFMIHRTYANTQAATSSRFETMAKSIRMDDERSEAIMREHLKLSPSQWAALDKDELYFTAKEALEVGFIQEIGDFAPPAGAHVYGI
jgi:ATP-dependent Clp protease protease subunit